MQSHFEHRAAGAAYLERLRKALPGKGWSRGTRDHWPDGAKLVISISLEFEAGADPDRNAGSPFGNDDGSERALSKWWEYGFKEGIPRLLDIFQRRHVRVTSHMAGQAVDRNPQLAREIVERGHEGAVRARYWSPQPSATSEDERRRCEADMHSIQQAAGTRPIGFHASGFRGAAETLEMLQDLGFLYYVDDMSRDEPFLLTVRGQPFVSVPYTLGLNDLIAYETRFITSDQF